MLPSEIENQLPQLFAAHFGDEFLLRSVKPLSGGSINTAMLLKTNLGDFFMKYNLAAKYPEMFECEAKGLQELENTNSVNTPKVLFTNSSGKFSFIVLEFIRSGSTGTSFWKSFAISLAKLHRTSNQKPGLSYHNYIGSIRQNNDFCDSWTEFFITKRIEPMLEAARNNGYFAGGSIGAFDRLFRRLPDILPVEENSLLHGDLWSGNFIADSFSETWLIDPAVYYGNREMDIAMTMLFGGFSREFYDAYNDYYPLQAEWEERVDICNLYPLLVHVNLFGSSYESQVKSIISRF